MSVLPFSLKVNCRIVKNSLLVSVLLYRYSYLGINPVVNITTHIEEMNLRDTMLQRFSLIIGGTLLNWCLRHAIWGC